MLGIGSGAACGGGDRPDSPALLPTLCALAPSTNFMQSHYNLRSLHCGGDLGSGKAKGRGRVGWSELCLVPNTRSPLWHRVAGNTLLLISTRAISVFAEQDGFSHLPGSQGRVNDCPDDRDFCLLLMKQSRFHDSVPNQLGRGTGTAGVRGLRLSQ